MITTNEIKRFEDWSTGWKAFRKTIIIDPVAVSNLWQKAIPGSWTREIWEGKLGYRKRTETKGEKRIEKELFNGKSKGFELTFLGHGTDSEYRLEPIYHNMPLASRRKGQVIADAFGVLKSKNNVRPIIIEVKVTANNPWFALIENLQQIRLARACARKIQAFVHENSKHRVERGVWGLILAPERYYAKHRRTLDQCKLLLEALKQNARARVAFGVSDHLDECEIKIIAHNWLTVRGSNCAT